MRYVFLLTLLLAAIGCQEEGSPSAFYEHYNRKVISGMSTLEEDAAFYSARKRAEAESKILELVNKTDRTRDEAIRLYLEVSQAVAKCKAIELADEVVMGGVAYLTYAQTDICGNQSQTAQTQKIRLVLEDGWKIDEIEISL